MKTKITRNFAFGFVAVLFVLMAVIYLSPTYIDSTKEDVKEINLNLIFTKDLHPEISRLIDDVYDDGERVAYTTEFSNKFSKKFNVKHIDLSCGRLFLLQEKSWLWGYRRTFILHREIKTKNLIMIDNSSSQSGRLDLLVKELKNRANAKTDAGDSSAN